MILQLKEQNIEFSDITYGQSYFVIGIEADYFRILNDHGTPCLYPSYIFEIISSDEPEDWITEFGEDGERYSYSYDLNEVGFFEDFFDGKPSAISKFWHNVNKTLSKAA